ncbi:hypothetical protein BATDEDRAFT_91754 [Batrachochytrium dendrobatidis JAM81]|nr:uncharacterized protein BATDEDRAFT_91754 [Batrachochytrium dendrobatidis JAM81]EGF77474.1 hypothetical protein BATDEDRAFT_91754 [Batrachochytrium dendrobatidis JAM81]KAJ8327577.1 hypothetical protein O5D80_003933 [Batrachochytrium dendrobatidis]KAK5671931.1 hypothetical protein QVD99_001756 [Batrachochytrium dendrobatidis]|eukprot:XP_006682091.1 hypothetical protein BATDEDRAFT_91754 [Batrachochytrium dendrobatidis JAM81]
MTLFLFFTATSVTAANVTVLCKCECAPNSTILSVPSCNGCTKLFCIESNACFMPLPKVDIPATTTSVSLTATSSTSSESISPSPSPTLRGDESWTAVCFQRGSFKDEIIVYAFIILTTTLVAFALIKPFLAHVMREYDLPGYVMLMDGR